MPDPVSQEQAFAELRRRAGTDERKLAAISELERRARSKAQPTATEPERLLPQQLKKQPDQPSPASVALHEADTAAGRFMGSLTDPSKMPFVRGFTEGPKGFAEGAIGQFNDLMGTVGGLFTAADEAVVAPTIGKSGWLHGMPADAGLGDALTAGIRTPFDFPAKTGQLVTEQLGRTPLAGVAGFPEAIGGAVTLMGGKAMMPRLSRGPRARGIPDAVETPEYVGAEPYGMERPGTTPSSPTISTRTLKSAEKVRQQQIREALATPEIERTVIQRELVESLEGRSRMREEARLADIEAKGGVPMDLRRAPGHEAVEATPETQPQLFDQSGLPRTPGPRVQQMSNMPVEPTILTDDMGVPRTPGPSVKSMANMPIEQEAGGLPVEDPYTGLIRTRAPEPAYTRPAPAAVQAPEAPTLTPPPQNAPAPAIGGPGALPAEGLPPPRTQGKRSLSTPEGEFMEGSQIVDPSVKPRGKAGRGQAARDLAAAAESKKVEVLAAIEEAEAASPQIRKVLSEAAGGNEAPLQEAYRLMADASPERVGEWWRAAKKAVPDLTPEQFSKILSGKARVHKALKAASELPKEVAEHRGVEFARELTGPHEDPIGTKAYSDQPGALAEAFGEAAARKPNLERAYSQTLDDVARSAWRTAKPTDTPAVLRERMKVEIAKRGEAIATPEQLTEALRRTADEPPNQGPGPGSVTLGLGLGGLGEFGTGGLRKAFEAVKGRLKGFGAYDMFDLREGFDTLKSFGRPGEELGHALRKADERAVSLQNTWEQSFNDAFSKLSKEEQAWVENAQVNGIKLLEGRAVPPTKGLREFKSWWDATHPQILDAWETPGGRLRNGQKATRLGTQYFTMEPSKDFLEGRRTEAAKRINANPGDWSEYSQPGLKAFDAALEQERGAKLTDDLRNPSTTETIRNYINRAARAVAEQETFQFRDAAGKPLNVVDGVPTGKLGNWLGQINEITGKGGEAAGIANKIRGREAVSQRGQQLTNVASGVTAALKYGGSLGMGMLQPFTQLPLTIAALGPEASLRGAGKLLTEPRETYRQAFKKGQVRSFGRYSEQVQGASEGAAGYAKKAVDFSYAPMSVGDMPSRLLASAGAESRAATILKRLRGGEWAKRAARVELEGLDFSPAEIADITKKGWTQEGIDTLGTRLVRRTSGENARGQRLLVAEQGNLGRLVTQGSGFRIQQARNTWRIAGRRLILGRDPAPAITLIAASYLAGKGLLSLEAATIGADKYDDKSASYALQKGGLGGIVGEALQTAVGGSDAKTKARRLVESMSSPQWLDLVGKLTELGFVIGEGGSRTEILEKALKNVRSVEEWDNIKKLWDNIIKKLK